MKKKLVLMTSALMAIGLLAGCGSQHTHNWGEVTYTWSADNTTCTAERVCKGDESHKETEVANSTYNVVSEAKCEEDGTGRYSVSFTNEAFTAQTKDVTLEAIGHEWGEVTYTWSDDNSTCTARRVCAHDATHVDTETVNSTYIVVEEAKCEEDGKGRYTADFTSEAFVDQTKDITLKAIGHSLIAHDAHAETCTEAGNAAYWSCERCEKLFSDEEGKNETTAEALTIAALGHDYQFDSFVWADDYTAQAKYVCSRDNKHVEMHDATVTSKVTKEATCEEEGVKTYTATYEQHSETKTGPIAALGHDYQFDSFVWADDFTAKAKYVCSRDDKRVEMHDATVTSKVTKEATCEEEGVKTYTATYEQHSETKTGPIAALGHDYQFDSFVWADDYTAKAKYVCSHDNKHVVMHDATVTSKVTKEAGCEDGVETYTATYDVHTETKEKVLPKLGHTWGEPTYEWSEGGKYCTATAICERDSAHKKVETVECKFTELEAATEEADGKGKYTATFESEEFATQEKEVVIESLPTLSKLAFTKAGDGTYSVKFKNSSITGRVKIPSTYGEGEAEGIVTTLPDQAFFDVNNITEVFIPSSVKTIGNKAFYNCGKITDIHFAENSVLESIGDCAFQRCNSLVSLTLPKSVKTLGEEVFYQITNLESVVFEEGNELESIGPMCFENCTKLKTIKFAETSKFKELDQTFATLDALEELDLPNSVESMTAYSVVDCNSLKTLWLSKGLKTMSKYSINYCPIENLHFKGTMEEWNKIGKPDKWYYPISTSVVHCTDGDVAI